MTFSLSSHPFAKYYLFHVHILQRLVNGYTETWSGKLVPGQIQHIITGDLYLKLITAVLTNTVHLMMYVAGPF